MKRENKFLVIKNDDIDKYLNYDDKVRLARICRDIQAARRDDGEDGAKNYVVVAHNWPMYEDTWQSVENWVHDQVATGDLPDTEENQNTSPQPTDKNGMPISIRT